MDLFCARVCLSVRLRVNPDVRMTGSVQQSCFLTVSDSQQTTTALEKTEPNWCSEHSLDTARSYFDRQVVPGKSIWLFIFFLPLYCS